MAKKRRLTLGKLSIGIALALAMLTTMIATAATATASDDAEVSISDASAQEGDALEFTVSVSKPISKPIKIAWRVSGVEAQESDGDYPSGQQGHVKIKPRRTSTTVRINTTQDGRFEPDERVSVNIFPRKSATLPNGVVFVKNTAFGTIVNDDAQPVAAAPVATATAAPPADAAPVVADAADDAAPPPADSVRNEVCETHYDVIVSLLNVRNFKGILQERGCPDPEGWLVRNGERIEAELAAELAAEEARKKRARRALPSNSGRCMQFNILCEYCVGEQDFKVYALTGCNPGVNGQTCNMIDTGYSGNPNNPMSITAARVNAGSWNTGASVGTCTTTNVPTVRLPYPSNHLGHAGMRSSVCQ